MDFVAGIEFSHARGTASDHLKKADKMLLGYVADTEGAGPGHFQPKGAGAHHYKLSGLPGVPIGAFHTQGVELGSIAHLPEGDDIKHFEQGIFRVRHVVFRRGRSKNNDSELAYYRHPCPSGQPHSLLCIWAGRQAGEEE